MNNYQEQAKLFKALSDERRLAILQMLAKGEKCACDLLEHLEITQSTLSHHMKILIESQIVTQRKEGKWMYYTLSNEVISSTISYLQELTANNIEKRGACCD